MYKHIAVALDGSAYAAAAEDLALDLAGRMAAMVHAVHVVDTSFVEGAFITDISGALGFEPFVNLGAQVRTALEEVASTIRTRFLERCKNADIRCAFQIERTAVFGGILSAARLADLLIIGRRGLSARSTDDLLGHAAALLLRRSPVPLVIVPESARLPRNLLAAFDGSVKSTRALHEAAEIARELTIPLTVVTIESDAARAKSTLDDAARYLEPFEIEAGFQHERGEAIEQILLAMLGPGEFDMICLGAHGHNRVVELVLGSTSEYLARRSPVPVLCVTRA